MAEGLCCCRVEVDIAELVALELGMIAIRSPDMQGTCTTASSGSSCTHVFSVASCPLHARFAMAGLRYA